jgi:chromosome partitioning protein
MKSIAVAMAKGGVAKTTIAVALAVRAAEEFKVAGVDLNSDQANLTQWYQLRNGDDGEEDNNPQLFSDFDDVAEDLPALEHDGWEICIIDTPPSYYNVIETAIMIADAVVVPLKTSIHDAGTLETVVEMCRKYDKPFLIVLSDVDPAFKRINAGVIESLKASGLPFFEDLKISHRAAYMAAPNKGKTGAEINADAREEVNALWSAVARLAGIKKAKSRPTKRARGG